MINRHLPNVWNRRLLVFAAWIFGGLVGSLWGPALGVVAQAPDAPVENQPAGEESAKSAATPTPEFRIVSQTFVADQKQPVTRNLTLFSDGRVYDFQYRDQDESPSEIVILDTRLRRLILLDPARNVRLELADLQLLRILDIVRRSAEEDERTRFLVDTQYEEDVDPDRRQVTLKSEQIRYQFTGQMPENDNVLTAYFEFLDNFTRLQASDPSKLPPFPRIRLNQSIRRVGWIPQRVDMRVGPNAIFREPFEAHTEHQLEERLTPEDRQRMVTARQHWAQFKAVNLATYRALGTGSRTADRSNRDDAAAGSPKR